LWFIDGDHFKPVHDMYWALRAAAKGAWLIADDCTGRFMNVKAAFLSLVNSGQVRVQ